MEQTISITTKNDAKVIDTSSAPFGVQPTDHMFVAEYINGKWQNSRIIPFEHITISPFMISLHYGQTVFEGMKAFRRNDGKVSIFRPKKHYNRFNKSLQRMCMPIVPGELFMEALHQMIQLDADWIPNDENGSLYIRPFMFATEERLGVKIADKYSFMIVATPAYQYYTKPLKVKVEDKYVRSADGGTGFAKCGGNYGGAYYPTQLAQEQGYDQVIWTDSRRHEFIEESGTMNVMFVIDNVLITPPLSGTILDGVTRDSLLTLAKDLGLNVAVRPITHREIKDALVEGKKVEAFGTGTAAVVAPIEIIAIEGIEYNCYIGDNSIMQQLKKKLYDIRTGSAQDNHSWNYIL